MRSKNSPLNAQQPAPSFANDANGFWDSVLKLDGKIGLKTLLPCGTVYQSDVAIKSRLLSAQVAWTPTKAIFKGASITVSLLDSQFFLTLEEGGDTQQGRLIIIANKFEFQTGFPGYNDTLRIYSAGNWHELFVAEVLGQNDDNDPAITLYLTKDQNDYGE